MSEPIRLNLGGGHARFAGWINVDLDWDCRPDVLANLGAPLPFADGSVARIHCEDFIDQLPLEQGELFMRECRRVLAKDGVMRLLTPDLGRLIDYYVRGDERLIEMWRDSVGLPLTFATLGEVFSRAQRLGGHYFLYDRQTLTRLGEHCGFRMRTVPFNESDYEDLRGLDLRSPQDTLSMYFECTPA